MNLSSILARVLSMSSHEPRRRWPAKEWVTRLSAALLCAWCSASWAQSGPSRDINTYVMFAYDELRFNGDATGTGQNGLIQGSVGVNRVDPTPNDSGYLLNMGGGGGSHDVTMSDGSEIVADSARLDQDTSAYDLYVNILAGGSPPVVRHLGPTNFTHATATEAIIASTNLPMLPSLPLAPPTSPSARTTRTVWPRGAMATCE